MKISQVYEHYQIPPNLQRHMLQTAALGQIICDHWTGPRLKKKLVITTLLVHDMGNIVKFDFDSPTANQFLTGHKDVDYWRQVQSNFQKKYGVRADQANLAIIDEMGLSPLVKKFMKEHYFESLPAILQESDWEHKISFYCDIRFRPSGITSVEDRLEDLRQRYEHRDQTWQDADLFETRLENCSRLEAQLNQQTDLDIQAIDQADINNLVDQLTDYQIEAELE
jgi:hypothetical protein